MKNIKLTTLVFIIIYFTLSGCNQPKEIFINEDDKIDLDSMVLCQKEKLFDLNNANIIFDGNSLAYGNNTKGNPPSKFMDSFLNDIGYNVSVENIAVGGQTTLDVNKDVIEQITPLYNASVENIYIIWEIRNDLTKNQPEVKVAYQNMINLVEKVKLIPNQKWSVVVMTILPSWSGREYKGYTDINAYYQLDKDRLTVNEMILNDFSPADFVIDVNQLNSINDLGENTLQDYDWSLITRPKSNGLYSDGTHQTKEGAKLVGEYVAKKLVSFSI